MTTPRPARGFTGKTRPCESTIRRLFESLDGDRVDAVIGAYLAGRSTPQGARRIVAVDGKTVRGARTGDRRAPHLVAVYDHQAGVVLAQAQVDDKTNEIPCVQALLAVLDLTGTVVTADALHTQKITAQQIIDAGGGYVFTVKNNNPTLRAAIAALPWTQVPIDRTTLVSHGRRATRSIRVLQLPPWIDYPGARQVAQLRRTVTKKGRTTRETVYLITSAAAENAQLGVLADWIRGHWSIENGLHWVRDVTYAEPESCHFSAPLRRGVL